MSNRVQSGWTADSYNRCADCIRRTPHGPEHLMFLNTLFTRFCYVIYPLLLVWLFARGCNAAGGFSFNQPDFWRALLIPMVAFVAVSMMRVVINAPRPYQVLDIDPIIKKSTQGKSFPSRHVFSSFMIAMTWLYYCWPMGIVLIAVSVGVALCRVLGGVHYPRDVVVAAAIAIAVGVVGFWIF